MYYDKVIKNDGGIIIKYDTPFNYCLRINKINL